MIKRSPFWVNLATGILGLAVGSNNLYRWLTDDLNISVLIVGMVCFILGAGWIIYSWRTRSPHSGNTPS